MRREALAQTDLYDPRLPHSGDFDMWLRRGTRWDVGRVNGPRPGALPRARREHAPHDLRRLGDRPGRRRLTFQILFDERAPELHDVQALRPVAMRALAREARRRAFVAAYDADAAEVRDVPGVRG